MRAKKKLIIFLYLLLIGSFQSLFSAESGLLQVKLDVEQSYVDGDLSLKGPGHTRVFTLIEHDDRKVSFKIEPDDKYIRACDVENKVDQAPHIQAWEKYTKIDHDDGWFSLVSRHGTFLKGDQASSKVVQTGDFNEDTHFRLCPLVREQVIPLAGLNEMFGLELFREEDIIFVLYQDNRFPRADPLAITHSWLYMPLIRSALVGAGQESEKHLGGVIEERDFFRRGISIFADLVRILEHNLKAQEIVFEGDNLKVGGEEFYFDDVAHMNGDHQERFLRRFFALPASLLEVLSLELEASSQSVVDAAEAAEAADAHVEEEIAPAPESLLYRLVRNAQTLDPSFKDQVLVFEFLVNTTLIPQIFARPLR